MKKTLSRATLLRRVNKGIKFLDEVKPGWYKKINVRKLFVQSETSCVCGQVFGDFWKKILYEGTGGYGFSDRGRAKTKTKTTMTIKEAIYRGFILGGAQAEWDILQDIWYKKISKLQASAK